MKHTNLPTIAFSKQGAKMLDKLNQNLGKRRIHTGVLRSELIAYIAAHEELGKLDTQYQLLRYTHNLCVAIRKEQGVWMILEVFLIRACKAFRPVYIWKQLRKGIDTVLEMVLAGWRAVVSPVPVKIAVNCT